ncbi:fibronectin type III domain-containing protein [Rubritalea sp.]|uniref:fibronectin type III domain-containing protein n=1 Tax=Rubritalea sp. TaxID=2109375 RepID=UPI003EF50705
MGNLRLVAKMFLVSVVLLCSLHSSVADTTPRFTVFTYAGDPSTTLTVNWQTYSKPLANPIVKYGTLPIAEAMTGSHKSVEGEMSQIEGLNGRYIHRVHLTELTPNTRYYISLCDSDGKPLPESSEYTVWTIPTDDSPLRFVTGGDMGTSEDVRTLLRHAASREPNFAVVGGDVAYANGQLGNVHLWDKWLTYYTEEMVTSEGDSIPLIVGVGNHETQGMFGKTFKDAPFISGLFGQDMKKNHFSRRFGENLALLILDSNHTASHESQVDWIRSELTKFEDVPYTVAVYHVPLYPSHRGFMEEHSALGRKYWAPVFDEMNLTVAFENHDHTHKRSHLIKDGKVSTDGTGTLYLGDGCWGRNVREIDYGGRWYLKECTSSQHFWCVDSNTSGIVYRAVGMENQVFDVYPEDNPEAAAAGEIREGIKNAYMLPKSCTSSPGYKVAGNQWMGGATTIKVTNSFKHPMRYSLSPAVRGKQVKASGFSDARFTLASGETKEHAVSYTANSKKPLPLNKVRLGYWINAEIMLPEPIKIRSNFSLPLHREN